MITTSTNYQTATTQKFIELKNLTDNPKLFKPAPLNSLNSLTIKIKDNSGNILDYRNQYLNLKNITFIPSELGISLSNIDDETKYELNLTVGSDENTVSVTNDINNYLLTGIKSSIDDLSITNLTTKIEDSKLNLKHSSKDFILEPVVKEQINIETKSSTVEILRFGNGNIYAININNDSITYTTNYLDTILGHLKDEIEENTELTVTKNSDNLIIEGDDSIVVEPETNNIYELKFNDFDLTVSNVALDFEYTLNILIGSTTSSDAYTLTEFVSSMTVKNNFISNFENTLISLDISYEVNSSSYDIESFNIVISPPTEIRFPDLDLIEDSTYQKKYSNDNFEVILYIQLNTYYFTILKHEDDIDFSTTVEASDDDFTNTTSENFEYNQTLNY